MTSLTSGLIPVAGASGGSRKEVKKADLTGGLIAIGGGATGGSAQPFSTDDDFGDFDVDDLLLEDTASSKSKVKSKKASSPDGKTLSTKKNGKKSSSGSSSSSGSGSKKKKDKKKSKDGGGLGGVLEDESYGDNFDRDDEEDSFSATKKKKTTSRWGLDDDGNDSFAVPVKKNALLDDEFARMLGLESESSFMPKDTDIGEQHQTQEDKAGILDQTGETPSNDSFARNRGNKTETSGMSSPQVYADDTEKEAVDAGDGGLSASFFQDDRGAAKMSGDIDSDQLSTMFSTRGKKDKPSGGGDGGDDFLSFFSSGASSERRGARGAGRRGHSVSEDEFGASASSVISDPFGGKGSRSTRGSELGNLDDLFGPRSKGLPAASPTETKEDKSGDASLADPATFKKSPPRSTFDTLFAKKPSPEKNDSSDDKTLPRGVAKTKRNEPSASASAKDDLLAELFPSIAKKSPPKLPQKRDAKAKEEQDAETSKPVAKPVGFSSSRAGIQLNQKFPGKQQDDLLAELFAGDTSILESVPSHPRGGLIESPSRSPSRSRSSSRSGSRSPLRRSHSSRLQPDEDTDVQHQEMAPQSLSRKESLAFDEADSNDKKQNNSTKKTAAKLDASVDIDSVCESPVKPLNSPIAESPPPARLSRRLSRMSDEAEIDTAVRSPASEKIEPPKPSTSTSPNRPENTSRHKSLRQDVPDDPSPSAPPSPQQQERSSKEPGVEHVVQPAESPGRTKTLELGTPAKAREVAFEHSKADLLEEILSSPPVSPTPSPIRAKPTGTIGNTTPDRELRGDERTREAGETIHQNNEHVQPAADLAASPDKEVSVVAPVPMTTPAPPTPRREPPVIVSSQPVVCPIPQQNGVAVSNISVAPVSTQASAVTDSTPPTQPTVIMVSDTAAIAAAVSQAEDALNRLHAAAVAQFISDLAARDTQIQRLQQQLDALTTQHTETCTNLADTQRENARHVAEIAQHVAKCARAERELTTLRAQHEHTEAQHRCVQQQLVDAQAARQDAELRVSQWQRDHEQASTLARQRERQQMDALYTRVNYALAQLSVTHEQSATNERLTLDNEQGSRMRMIASLEQSSRTYATQSERECHRLEALLSQFESTLRNQRQEHLDEKERLRREQARLDVLASHLQAQTRALQESTDANQRRLAEVLAASRQDVRTAESRLEVRRRDVDEQERKLFEERARIAAHLEQVEEEQDRQARRLREQREMLEQDRRELLIEREDLEHVLAEHEGAFQALRNAEASIQEEKESVARAAQHVAALAQHLATCSSERVEEQRAVQTEIERMKEEREEWIQKREDATCEKKALEQRESRLHTQLAQLQRARRRLHEDRMLQSKQHQLQSKSPYPGNNQLTHDNMYTIPRKLSMGTPDNGGSNHGPAKSKTYDINKVASVHEFVGPQVSKSSYYHHDIYPTATVAPLSTARQGGSQASSTAHVLPSTPDDPSGLSPSFRALIETHWNEQQRGDWRNGVAGKLHKERIWINCLGLDTSRNTKGDKNSSDRASDAYINAPPTKRHSSARTNTSGVVCQGNSGQQATRDSIPRPTAVPQQHPPLPQQQQQQSSVTNQRPPPPLHLPSRASHSSSSQPLISVHL